MPEQRRPIFREQSLEKLSSPERLDQLMRVIKPQGWIILLALGVGLTLAGIWSVLGTIPANADGTAVLIYPTQLVSFQSPGNGQLYTIDVRVGQVVKEGDVLATIKDPNLDKEIKLEQDRLLHFEERSEALLKLGIEKRDKGLDLIEQRRAVIDQRRNLLVQRRQEIQEKAVLYREATASYITAQLGTIGASSEMSRKLGKDLERLQAGIEGLKKFEIEEGKGQVALVDDVQVLDAKSRTIANQLELLGLEDRARGLDLESFKAEQAYDERLDKLKDIDLDLQDLEIELRDLDLKASQLESELALLRIDQDAERDEIERRIDLLEDYRDNETLIRAKFSGKIIEITAIEGQQVSVGQRLGKIERQDETALRALAYFSLRDGKKINPGQEIRISPATVERERYGAIRGEIVRRSDYAISTEAAANQIGDLELARNLLRGENRIEVEAVLLAKDTPTGFAWTSGEGPKDENKRPTAGTTAEARVTIEKRTPITLILPFLKGMFGLD